MSDFNLVTVEQKLKSSLHTDCKLICEDVEKQTEIQLESNVVELLTEFIWKKLQIFAFDLELFAKHAKRTTINVDDVKLLVRHNEFLKNYLNNITNEVVKTKKEPKKSTARKRKAPDENKDSEIIEIN